MGSQSLATHSLGNTALRLVKTRLLSMIDENRLSRLCMFSVHRKLVNSEKDRLIKKTLALFDRKYPLILQFVFDKKELQ